MKHISRIFSIFVIVGMMLGLLTPGTGIANAQQASSAQTNPVAKLESQLLSQLNSGPADFIVMMTEQADVSGADQLQTKLEKGQYVFDTLVATASRTQTDLRAYLDSQSVDYQSFYIVNAIWVKQGTLDLAQTIAARPDVSAINANHTYQLEQPINPIASTAQPQAVEPNISFLKADQVWAMGYTGQGMVVADDDTGLDNTHPAIARHYRGCVDPPACTTWDHNYNWYDAFDPVGHSTPWDDYGHGTHTAGTMVGDDGAGNQIGMAPGAQLISCKNMVGGGGDDAHFIICFQWDLAPWDLNGQNPLPGKAPDSVNNSWGYSGGGVNSFRTVIDNLLAAGIVVEVSAGNEGSGCQSLRSPGDYLEVFTTGSVNHAYAYPGLLTGFSSRGPSVLDGNYFPDFMAPGENVRSSLPGNQYAYWSGTSMAGPHVTALISLIWSANPALRGQIDTTYSIIQQTSVPLVGQPGSNCGGDYSVGPNNDWGYGTVDALAAVNLAISYGGAGTLQGTVTDAVTTLPVAGATVHAVRQEGGAWTTTTDASGFYQITVAAGTFDITTSHPHYLAQTVNDVVVAENGTTTQDFSLTPRGWVFGYVTDFNNGSPLANATVSAEEGSSTTTDGTGYYELWLDPGDHTITASITDYASASATITIISGQNTQLDFALLAAIAVVPDPIQITLQMGQTGSIASMMTNNMDVPYPFEFREKETQAGILVGEDILVVSKDPTAATAMETALTTLGVSFLDVTDTAFQAMTVPELLGYQAVFYAGTTGYSGTPSTSETLLVAYLDAGGQLYISDNDLGYYRTGSVFYDTYLQSAYLADNGGDILDGEAMMTGLTLDVTNDPYPDSFTVGAEGTRIFKWATADNAGGILVQRNGYQAIYTSFDFQQIASVADATEVINRIVNLYLTSDVLWFSTSITNGTLPAGESIGWTNAFSATTGAGIGQPGDYNAVLRIVPVGDPSLPDKAITVHMSVLPSADFGQIIGNVTSDRPGGALEANILIEATDGTTVTLTTDPATGYYSYWLAVGTYAVTASAGGYIPQTAQVEVIGQQNTTQNFELLLNSPKIGVDPTSFEVILELGQVTADTMTISNDGLQPLDFQLFEYPGGFSPGHAMQQINASGGPDPFGYTYADSNEPGGALYSWIDATDGTALNLDDDGEANAEMPFSFNFYGTDSTSLRIGNNGGILFNVTIGDLTYSNTDLGSATTNNLIAPFWDDMDADTGNVYYKTVGIAPYRQFIVEWFDRPHYSNVGNATFEVILYETRNDIKFQYQDVVFGDAGFDNGASATVGIREVNPNYLQYSYNQAVIQDSMAICFRYPGSIPCDVVDVPWISEQPTNGTVPVAGTADVQVTFDASAVSEPGTYTATMLIENNDPLMPVVNVPVTMHVLPTADLGRLEGTVTGLGYCDAQSNPLVADLLIENGTGNTWTVASDPTGYYFAWLPADTYTVTVSALDHLDASGVAIIVGQQTTTLDFALRFIESCMDVSPTAFTITLPVDTQLTQTLSIINNGAGDLSWEIHETTATLRTIDQNVIVNVPAISKPFVPVASRGILTSWPAREFSMHIGQVSANPINVLLVTPDVVGGGDISLLLNTLSAFPDLNVTLWDASTGTPTVSDMQAYDVVFVGNDILWTSSAIDKITLSNNMADYIDAGGKVLAGSFIWSYDDWGFGGGRFLTGAYSPFEIATTDFFIPAVLGNFDANNPLMAGITSITDNFNHQDTNLSSNGTWVASWDDGNNYVATAPNVVGLNQEYFYHADFGGQTGELLHNALLYLGAAQEWIDVPWVTEVPTSGVTLPDSTFNVEVVFNSTGLTPGECYSANLGLIHDDPGKDSPFFIPLGLCIEPPVYGVNLEPESSSGTGLPGETITYTVRITNTGNTADTFQLTYSNVDPDWTVVLPVSNFNLAAGQSVDAAVLVTIPVGAVNGDFDTFTLTATSAHEPQAFDDVEITTNVETVMFNIWLPLMYKG